MSNRKKFLRQAGILTVAGCCGGISLLLESCKGPGVVNHFIEGNQVKLKLAELQSHPSGVVPVRDDRLPGPVLVVRGEDNRYTAVLMICTHKSCELDLAGKLLICPCHGSEFSAEGKVLSAPAEEDLPAFQTSTEGEFLIIHLPS